MAEQWFAIFRDSDGGLVSVGTDVGARLPDGLSAAPLTERPDFALVEWNPTTRTLKARTPTPPAETQLDRIEKKLDDLLARPTAARIP